MDYSYKDQFPWNYILGVQNLPEFASKQREPACDSWLLVGQWKIIGFILAAPVPALEIAYWNPKKNAIPG